MTKTLTFPAALAALLAAAPLTGISQGFPAAPTTWAVPPSGNAGAGAYGFYALNNTTSVANRRSWSVLDMNGDNRPDIVATSIGNGSSTGLGRDVQGTASAPAWEVYLNTGTGFAAAPTTWAVPPSGNAGAGAYGFYDVSNITTTANRRSWNVLDINGDNRPDIVATSIGNGSSTGLGRDVLGTATAPTWEVYLSPAGVSATAPGSAGRTCEVYPNPTADRLTLRTALELRGTAYRLLDALGRVQATGTVRGAAQDLDLRALAAGVYTLQLLTATPQHLRVVKE